MIQAILFLSAALIFVPLAVRLGLGSVLGYLVAGIAVGPFGLSMISDPEAILEISELGVVLMLFVIGLELEPKRLWAMRQAVFGGGTLQMLLCAALIFPLGLALGWTWQASLMGGLAMALSSTAIAVAIMQERNLMSMPVGRTGFSMLLYQDIAAIPLLALAATLGTQLEPDVAYTTLAHGKGHARGGGDILLQLGALVGVVLFGRFVAYRFLRYVASMKVRELFTGFSLLLVLGVAGLMEQVGLSMGLGAFLAGVLLASSEYRHALEADILPFKGLLLGLFFIAVGMSMDLALLVSAPTKVLVGLLLIVAFKFLGLWVVSSRCGGFIGTGKLRRDQRLLLAVLLSQVGEFAFVVIAAAAEARVLPTADASLLTLIAALSMATTPLLLLALDKWGPSAASKRAPDTIVDESPSIIVAGFGRYGQTVGRLLLASGIRATVIDHDSVTVDAARRFGFKVYFGDATQNDLLNAAGIASAKAVVVAIDDKNQTDVLVTLLVAQYPHLKIIVRARNAVHHMELEEKGVFHVEREVFESGLRSARAALEVMGFDRYQSKGLADNFRRHSKAFLAQARASRHDEKELIATSIRYREQMEQEILEEISRVEGLQPVAWNPPAQ